MNLSRLSPARIARSLVTVLVLTLIQSVVAPVLNIAVPEARAATLYDNRSNFQQWTTWQSVSTNHLPYKTSAGTDVITSNTDAINLTQDAGNQVGFLWNTQVFSYAQDLTVSANYYFGAKDGADGIVFSMRPLDQWPNDGVAGSSTGGVTYWATGELRVIFDTYQNGIEMADDHLRVIAVTNAGANTEYNPSGTALKNGSGTTVSDVETDAYFPFTVKWTAASRTIAVYSGLTANHLIYSTTVSAAAMNATQFSWGWMGYTGGASNFQAVSSVNYHVSPTVSTTATDTTVTDGDQVTFTASYTSTESSPTTRWEYSTDGGSTWISTESTTSTYTFTATRAFTQRKYRFLVYSTAVGATYTNATTPVTLTVNPLPLGRDSDTALSLNGSNQYASVADHSTFDIRDAITIEAWVNPSAITSGVWNFVVNKESAYQLGISTSGFWAYSFNGDANAAGISTGIPVKINEWHHIAITRPANTNQVKFYYDGYLAFEGSADGAGTGQIVDASTAFSIGRRASDGRYFQGKIDHVALFDVARSADDIKADMNNYISPITPSLRAYYDFNEGAGSGTTLYNRKAGASSGSDLGISGSPIWSHVAEESVAATAPYTVVKFPRTYITVNGGWKVPAGVTRVSAVVVGGGGGGNAQTDNTGWMSGGGGAGGYQFFTTAVSPGSIESVTVGMGGRVGAKKSSQSMTLEIPTNGQDSKFLNRTSLGGGYGGGMSSSTQGTNSVGATGGVGGSGGGGGTYSGAGGAGSAGQGNSGGAANGVCCSSGGGGGAGGPGGAGGATGSAQAGNGGAAGNGVLNPIYVVGFTPQYLAAGGAGGSYYGASGSVGTQGGVAFGASAVANTGSGGGGGGGGASSVAAGSGGSGIVIIRWITALVPTYTKPTNAYLNVGMTETFTTNVAQDSATVGLTRTFKWESTTPLANGVYTLIKQGTGAANASFSWVPTDTSTSGSGYLFRLTVTDSDTAGLFITDSSTAYAVINRPLTVTGSSTFGKTINVARSETFTITLGTSTYRPILSPVIPGITLDTSTAGIAVVKISETMTVGTYYETLTVIDSVSASVAIPLTIKVAAPPSFSQSAAVVESGIVYHLDPGNSASYPRTGSVISDLSGRNRTGSLGFNFGPSTTPYTYKDGSTRNNNWQAGITCSAPTFSNTPVGNFSYSNGVCSYVPNIETVTTYTYDIWFNSSSSQTPWSPIVTTPYFNSNDQIMFSLNWLSGNTLAAGLFDGSSWWHTPTFTVSAGIWTHATVTFNGTTLTLILNGDVSGKKTVPVTAFDWNAAKIVPAIQFAKKWDGALYFNGSIGSFRLYNRVLTNAEILQNYLASSSHYAGTLNTPTKSAKYGSRYADTYTAFSRADSFSTRLASPTNGLRWDTNTVLTAGFLYQDSLTVGTYSDTITVTDNFGGTSFLPITLTVSKADTLTVSMDTATAVNFNKSPITVYPKPVFRGLVGSDTLTVTTKFSSQLYALSATVPTNADTYTVIAADPVFTFGAASNYQAIVYETSTAVVRKIAQRPLGIFMYGGVVGSPFLISLSGGDGDGVVTETLTGVSSIPGCAISNHYLTSSASVQGFCEVLVVKAASQNYFSESQTAQLYFMAFINNQPTGQIGSGSTIAINGATSLSKDLNAPPVITSLSSTSISLSSQGEFWINGSGFSNGGLRVTFWDEVDVSPKSVTDSKITFDISAIAAEGATSGRIAVRTVKGPVVSIDTLVINP